MPTRTKKITVVTNAVYGTEAIYLNGKLEFEDDIVYACDICEVAGSGPVILKHEVCELESSSWPEILEDWNG